MSNSLQTTSKREISINMMKVIAVVLLFLFFYEIYPRHFVSFLFSLLPVLENLVQMIGLSYSIVSDTRNVIFLFIMLM